MRQRITTILLVLAFLTGISLLLYPSVSNYWNNLHQSRAVAAYTRQTTSMTEEEYEEILKEAEEYNERLLENGTSYELTEEEIEEYNSILDITGTGIMGYISIPRIDVQLPIYHGTDDGVLQIAIGHLTGSSLPVGGIGTHTILSGHRGLPSATLFTDLDELASGDQFTITVLNRTLTYEVDQIRIVLPNQLDDLEVDEGEDYCTLVTCTPYGINTHRLLVRGHRIETKADAAHVTSDALLVDELMVALVLTIVFILIMEIMIYMIGRKGKRRGKQ